MNAWHVLEGFVIGCGSALACIHSAAFVLKRASRKKLATRQGVQR